MMMAQQIVLKLLYPPSNSTATAQSIAPSVLSAMQRLVELVIQLRSATDREAANHSPHTPDTLSLYVFEEAQDVLDALHHANQDGQESIAPSTSSAWQGYFWLNPLASWLLWGTARSSYEIMRLMEGCAVNCLQPDQTWQTHILRLVPLLSLHIPDAIDTDTSYTIDLATDLATDRVFVGKQTADRIIQFDLDQFGSTQFPSVLPQSPIATTELLTSLVQQIQTATPAIVPFLQSIPADFLIPQRSWQTGSIQLHYELEIYELEQNSLSSSLPAAPRSIPQIKFTDPSWLDQYQALIVQQQLISPLNGTPELSVAADVPSSSISALVASACQIADRLQQGWDIATRRFVMQSLNCNELAARLHWCLIHSAYEVMQLISGVPATLLCPQSSCQTGTLRFLVALRIQTPDSEWILDLATGQAHDTKRSPLPVDAIVQSEASKWCEQPHALAHLEATLWQQVHRFIPEIRLLLQGTEIDLLINPLDHTQEWQPGTIQLQGQFEFVSHSERLKAKG